MATLIDIFNEYDRINKYDIVLKTMKSQKLNITKYVHDKFIREEENKIRNNMNYNIKHDVYKEK
jgi:hypothetical protein